MNKPKNKRKQLFANKLHSQTVFLVFIAGALPAVITTICLYYLIFGVMADQLSIPEVIAYNILPAAEKVFLILAIALPISIIAILIIAHRITFAILGPFDRIIRELDEHLKGEKKGHINLRKGDKFLPLVDRVNELLDRLEKTPDS